MRGARLGGAAEGLEIDPHQSEMFRIAAGPLEIVEERPIDVAMHGNAVLHARPPGLERAVNEYDPPRIVVGRDAAFGDIDRTTVPFLPDRERSRTRPRATERAP